LGVLSRLANTTVEMAARLDVLAERGLKTWVEEFAVLHALQVQAQALLDLVVRIAAELGYRPTSPREAARLLLAEGLIDDDEYALLRRVAGFRNVVVHEYMVVDMGVVRSILGSREYRRVARLAVELLERAEGRGVDC